MQCSQQLSDCYECTGIQMHPGKAIVPAQRSKVGPAGSTRMRAFVSEKLMRALQIRKAFHDLSEADRGKAEVRKKIELKLIHCV